MIDQLTTYLTLYQNNGIEFINNHPILIRILGYFLIIILLHTINTRSNKGQKKVIRSFIHQIDNVFFEQAKAVYDNKNSIHDYKSSVSLLFNAKNQIFKGKNKSYLDNFKLLQQDIQYIQDLTQQKIISTELEITIQNHVQFLNLADKLNSFFFRILSIGTLGLYYFIAPKKLY